MIVLQAQHLEKSYIVDPVFKDVSFTIQSGDKIGLIGPNGAGKSTLFKCLIGDLSIDGGTLSKPNDITIGYLEQRPDYQTDRPLFSIVLESFNDILEKRNILRNLEKEMSNAKEDALDALYSRYAEATADYESCGGYSVESRAKGIIRGLGFCDDDFTRAISSFSGGERNRIDLARLLVREPDILLLDEPTNHLDLFSVQWLEQYLANYNGTVFMISHDRYFLDKTVTQIYELSHKTLSIYRGNYSCYLILKEKENEERHKAYLEQQQLINKEKAFIEKYRAGVKSRQARGREKKLSRIERLDDIQKDRSMNMGFFEVDTAPRIVLEVERLSKSFDEISLFEDLSFVIENGDKVGLIGKNGSGKSTLLKVLCGEIDRDDGIISFGPRIRMGYYDQEQAILNDNETVLEQILYHTELDLPRSRAELARMMFYEEDLEKKVNSLSGGEKARLSLLLLLLQKPNFIIMDEPTNHLDIASKTIMENYLSDYPGTLLIVSHDRYFLDEVTTKTFELNDKKLSIYLGNYSYYKEKKAELIWKEQQTTISSDQIPPNEIRPIKKKQPSKSKLKVQYETLEKEIADIETALEKEQTILTGTAVTEEAIDYAAIAANIAELEKKLERAYEEWTDVAETLEELLND